MKVECPRCQTHVEKPAVGDPVCPTCGFGAPLPDSMQGDAPAATAPDAPAMAPPAPSSTSFDTTSGASGWGGSATPSTAGGQKQTGMPLTALILACIGFLTGVFFIGMVLDVVAIVLGVVARNRAKQQPAVHGGEGMALAAIIIGAAGLLLMVLFLLFAADLGAAACESLPPEEQPPECAEFESQAAPVWAPGVTAVFPRLFPI